VAIVIDATGAIIGVYISDMVIVPLGQTAFDFILKTAAAPSLLSGANIDTL
jgi:uracil-DNA glycosylase